LKKIIESDGFIASLLLLIFLIFPIRSYAGIYAYIPNAGSNNVSVIRTSDNTVTATVPVGTTPIGVSVSPDGRKVYVANQSSNTISVISTTNNTVTATFPFNNPEGVSVSPDGTKVYVANYGNGSNNVSVIRSSDNTVTATVPVGSNPYGVSVSPDGTKVYVANYGSNNVSVIRTSDNTVIATVPVGIQPYSLGNFIATVPEPSPASIPTLSEWTQMALAFMTFGLLFWCQKRESV